MLTQEHVEALKPLLEDLNVDLLNGNVPAIQVLIPQIVNLLIHAISMDWKTLATFITGKLEQAPTRTALLHFLPQLQEMICPSQPEPEATTS